LDQRAVSSCTITLKALLTIASVWSITLTSLALGVAASSSSTGGDEQTGGVVAITFPVLDCATVAVAFIGNVGLFGVDALLQSGLGADGTLFIVDIPVAWSSLC